MLGALALTTVNVTGPAGTLLTSSVHSSFPPAFAMVTLTCPVKSFLGALEPPPFGWPHAVAANTVVAVKSIADNHVS
ncbi:hypothetical protein MSIM_48030 [Mycobacterium simiae]|nr:hypothetical protein MSIM_48030 [Mycobacterium simiae]